MGQPQGEEGRELPVQPAGEVPHRGIDAHERGLRQPLLLQRFQERLGHGDEPLVRPVMLVELLVEGEEALQVAPLGIESRLGLPGDLGDQVHVCQVTEAGFGLLEARQNVMG